MRLQDACSRILTWMESAWLCVALVFDPLCVCERVCVLQCRGNREGVAGGQTGSQSQSLVYDNSNSIAQGRPGLWDSLPVVVCVRLSVIRQKPDPTASFLRFEWISDQGLYHPVCACACVLVCLLSSWSWLFPFLSSSWFKLFSFSLLANCLPLCSSVWLIKSGL